MRLLSMLVVILLVAGCTTLRPVELSPDQLQDRIPAGEIIQVGDSVVITTSDEEQHKFVVTSITDQRIAGKNIEVAIADIVAVGKRETSTAKTLSLTVASVIIVAVAISGVTSAPLQ